MSCCAVQMCAVCVRWPVRDPVCVTTAESDVCWLCKCESGAHAAQGRGVGEGVRGGAREGELERDGGEGEVVY